MTSTTPAVPHKNAILSIILVSYFMILLDNSVIFTALPSLQSELHLSATELAWVQDAYTLVFGGLLLLGARAGDLLGRKRVFILGLIIFASASLSIALAPTATWLIASRAVQGIGASLGLVLGGALASWISWRAGFFVNVPIGIAMIVLAPRYLTRIPTQSGRFDFAGAILSTAGVGGLVFAILIASEHGWTSTPTLVGLGTGIIALVLLVLAERRAAQPIMPLRLFASRERTGAYLTRFFYLAAMIGFFFFRSQFLQRVLGFTALQAGLAFLPMTVVNFGVAMLIPRLIRRVGSVPVLVAGIVLTLAGMVWLSRVSPETGYLMGVAAPMVLIGGGQGLAFAPMTSAGIAGTTAADAGAASGLVNTFHQLGSSLGLGILVATAAAAGSVAASATAATRLAREVSAALTAGSGLLALSLVITLALIVPAARTAQTPQRSPVATIHAITGTIPTA